MLLIRHAFILVLAFFCARQLLAQEFGPGSLFAPFDQVEYGWPESDLNWDQDEQGRDVSLATGDMAEVAAAELALSQEEVRRNFNYGVAAAFGTSTPWQTLGLDAYYVKDSRTAHLLSVGSGDWNFAGTTQGHSYLIEVKAQSFFYSYRYFLFETFPFFVQPSFGYVFWSGDVNPAGSDAEEDTDAQITTSLTGSGPVAGCNLGLAKVWESGVFIEYSLVGISKGYLLSKSFDDETTITKDAATSNLEKPTSWGLFNVKVGYMF